MSLRHLQDEVARDPGSEAFAALADLYRAQGRLEAAQRVCVRGLRRNPDHVEGHYVLGRIHRDAGAPQRAYDEWDIALTLDPRHAPSRRAIGFLCLERDEPLEAERHLRVALQADPDDPRIQRALRAIARQGAPAAPTAAYWDAVAAIVRPELERLAGETRVRHILAVDVTGQIVTGVGNSGRVDLAGVASLVAAGNASGQALARMLGQSGFSQHHQGQGDHQLFVGAIPTPGGDLLVACTFGTDAPLGLVRVEFDEMAARLAEQEWPTPREGAVAADLEGALVQGLARARVQAVRG